MPCKVMVVDYRTGNFAAVKRAVDRAGGDAFVSSTTSDIQSCDKIILAGVGHFERAMTALRELDLEKALNQAVLGKGKPLLGICLGMELMVTSSAEGISKGLGWIEGEAVRFSITDQTKYKVPHIGWNTLKRSREHPLFRNLNSDSEFYFNHSFHLSLGNEVDVLSKTEYEASFVSAIAKDNVFGVQFHPEKSHESGIQLLKNFLEI